VADETVLKYKADLSEITSEIDKVNAKLEKLAASLDKTAKKFGGNSPQATMVANAMKQAGAQLDKKIAALEKLNANFAKNGGGGDPGSKPDSSNRDLENRYKRESLRYYKDFSTAFGRTSKLVTGGISGLAQGEGLGGFQRGLKDISSSLLASGGKQFLASFAAGAAIKASAVSAVRKGTASKAAGDVAGAEEAGAVEESVAVGAGLGITRAFAAIPGPIKIAIGAIVGLGAAGVGAMTLATHDVFNRGKRAGGYGTNIGAMTAYEDTMGRFLDNPDNQIKASQQAMYDITSPAYTAMRVSGINPADWSDPTELAKGNIANIQRQLKSFGGDRGTVLTKAHALGFDKEGFSDEDLLRLYNGDQKEVNRQLKKASAKAGGLDISDEQRQKFDDLAADVALAADRFNTLNDKLMENFIPAVSATINKTVDFGDSLEHLVLKFKKWYDGLADVPSSGATAMEMTKDANGNFVYPGSNFGPGGSRGGGGPGRYPSGRKGGGGGGGDAEKIGPIDLHDPEAQAGNYKDAMRVLMKAGLTRNEAAGMAGNATAESGLGTLQGGRVLGEGTGDGGAASGMFQWHKGRWNKQVAWARSQGLDPRKPSTQLKMGAHEWITEWRKNFGPGVERARTPEEIERAINPFEGNKTGPGRGDAVGGTRRGLREGTDQVSMNNMSHFQGINRQQTIRIDNQAGANYAVSGGMLGSGHGNYG
jgi:hypothetical protein